MRRRESELDRDIAALLAARAFIEIRHLARSARLESGDSSEDTLERIRFLANLGPQPAGCRTPASLHAVPPGREPWELGAGDGHTAADRSLEHRRPEGAGLDTAPHRTSGTNLDAAPAPAGAP